MSDRETLLADDDFPNEWDAETWAAAQWVIEASKAQDHWNAMTNRANALTALSPPLCPIYRPIMPKPLPMEPSSGAGGEPA